MPAAQANIDPVRGPMNEGGLYGERMGWHLPGYQPPPTAEESSPLTGVTGAQGRFYTTTFALDLNSDLDVPIGLDLGVPHNTDTTTEAPAAIQIFLNGYQYRHYLPHIGPQTRFPFPPGVINNQGGLNTLAISLWALTGRGAKLGRLELFVYEKYRSGFGFGKDWGALQPVWVDRRGYA
ncbi:galactose-binding domain-like protein [Aspergillus crustosus]